MSRHHNTRHAERGGSHYADRLARRGQSGATVRMPALDDLRRVQAARASRQGHPWPLAGEHQDGEQQS